MKETARNQASINEPAISRWNLSEEIERLPLLVVEGKLLIIIYSRQHVLRRFYFYPSSDISKIPEE